MKKQTIEGKVNYFDLEGGFWGITDDKGGQWLPVNMPEQLKMKDRKIKVTIKEVDEETLFMWGTPVRILSFETLMP